MKSPIVLFSRTAEKEEDSEKKAEQNVETKLDSGKQKKNGRVKTLEPIALRKHCHMSS